MPCDVPSAGVAWDAARRLPESDIQMNVRYYKIRFKDSVSYTIC